jgi:ribosome-binding protein aMBF1 (putative translation factor)
MHERFSKRSPKVGDKNVCELCGAEAVTTEHDGALVCNECLRRLGKEEPELLDEEF